MKRESEKPGPTEALGSLSSKPQAGLHHCGLLGVAMSYRTVGCIALFLYAIAATSIYWFLLKVPADQAREDSCFIPDLIRNVLDLTCLPGDSQQKQRLGAGRALNVSRRECSASTHSNNVSNSHICKLMCSLFCFLTFSCVDLPGDRLPLRRY
jgi:hypothetical protein